MWTRQRACTRHKERLFICSQCTTLYNGHSWQCCVRTQPKWWAFNGICSGGGGDGSISQPKVASQRCAKTKVKKGNKKSVLLTKRELWIIFFYLSFTVIYSYFFFSSFAENHIYVDYIGAERAISKPCRKQKGYKASSVKLWMLGQTVVLWRNSFVFARSAALLFAWNNKWIINDRWWNVWNWNEAHLKLRASVQLVIY